MQNFTVVRNGIIAHRRAGKMPPFDSGIFDHLLARCDWETGIYHGCALALAFDFGDPSLKEAIQRCLRRLRDRKYINYPEGTGKRGGYDILIHKYEVAKGKLSGTRLNAWARNGLASPEYETQNGQQTVGKRSANGGQTVGTPIQDIQDLQDVQDKPRAHARDISQSKLNSKPNPDCPKCDGKGYYPHGGHPGMTVECWCIRGWTPSTSSTSSPPIEPDNQAPRKRGSECA